MASSFTWPALGSAFGEALGGAGRGIQDMLGQMTDLERVKIARGLAQLREQQVRMAVAKEAREAQQPIGMGHDPMSGMSWGFRPTPGGGYEPFSVRVAPPRPGRPLVLPPESVAVDPVSHEEVARGPKKSVMPPHPTGTPTTGGFTLNPLTKKWESYAPTVTKELKPHPSFEQSQVLESLRKKLGRDPEPGEFIKAEDDRKAALLKATTDAKTAQVDIPLAAQAVANGQMGLEAITNAWGIPVRMLVISEVLKRYPHFQMALNEANQKWPTNPSNMRTISMLEAALPRLNVLQEQAGKLPNTDIPITNKLLRQLSIQTGDPAYTNFESNRNAIVQELNTALSGSATGSDLRIRIELENIHSARSGPQLRGAIGNLREAMLSRLESSFSPLYPPEVVKGEKTRGQFVHEMQQKYRGKYGAEQAQGGGGLVPPPGSPLGPRPLAPNERLVNGEVWRRNPDGTYQRVH